MITQLRGLSLTKQRNLCITIERHAIRKALSYHGTYVLEGQGKFNSPSCHVRDTATINMRVVRNSNAQ